MAAANKGKPDSISSKIGELYSIENEGHQRVLTNVRVRLRIVARYEKGVN
jgi:hypothetical protein